MNNSITLSKLAKNPLIAYSIQIPRPEEFELSSYENTAYPAVFGNLTGMSIQSCRAKYRVGRVYSFDILPRSAPDPVILFSQVATFALIPYYRVWSDIMTNGLGFWRKRKARDFQESISFFIDSCKDTGILSIDEAVFGVLEMLKFNNDVILNQHVS